MIELPPHLLGLAPSFCAESPAVPSQSTAEVTQQGWSYVPPDPAPEGSAHDAYLPVVREWLGGIKAQFDRFRMDKPICTVEMDRRATHGFLPADWHYPGLDHLTGCSDGHLVFWGDFPVLRVEINSGIARRDSCIRLMKYMFVTAFGVFLRTAARSEAATRPLVFHSLYIDPKVQILFANSIKLVDESAHESSVEFSMTPLWHRKKASTQSRASGIFIVIFGSFSLLVTTKILPALARIADTNFGETPLDPPERLGLLPDGLLFNVDELALADGNFNADERATADGNFKVDELATGDGKHRKPKWLHVPLHPARARLGATEARAVGARSLFYRTDDRYYAKLMPSDAFDRASRFLPRVLVLHKWNLFDAEFVLVRMPNYGTSLWKARPPPENLRATALAVVRCVLELATAGLAHNDVRLPNLVVTGHRLPLSCRGISCLDQPAQIKTCARLALHQTAVCVLILAGVSAFPLVSDGYQFTEEYFQKHPPAPQVADIVRALVPRGYNQLPPDAALKKLRQVAGLPLTG
ncbi:hypothetical protein PAPYR_6225 [Paratrimastix pyriformis]|uniref:Protein kinase domain-containing protein n=1 Tax=Paratrimastix pyriformis TaxID=342808 RepID=A0ABQ8UFT3_9EUKA|nr:hypothetical protein PAPYR_6225 [Paratrimastix pyriformis]